MNFVNKFTLNYLIIYILLNKCIESVFIDQNFYVFLNQICLTHQKNIIFTNFRNTSQIYKYFNENSCNHYIMSAKGLNEEYSEDIRILDQKNVNLMIELNNDQDFDDLSQKVFNSYFSMNVNFILVLKSQTLIDIELNLFNNFNGFRCYVIRYENDLNVVKVSYIRPIINGCHEYNGILYSIDPKVKDMLTSQTCNLNGTHLKVVTNIVSIKRYLKIIS